MHLRFSTGLILNVGTQAAMVCQALVSIATHTVGTWEYVAPELMKYLKSKTEVHYEILVSGVVCLSRQQTLGFLSLFTISAPSLSSADAVACRRGHYSSAAAVRLHHTATVVVSRVGNET